MKHAIGVTQSRSWSAAIAAFMHRRVLTMLFFGFSAGVPILLIFGTLVVWLTKAGVDRSTVTFFSWAALGYSFKFVWAPLVDKVPLPLLTVWLGRRRAWILLSQIAPHVFALFPGAAEHKDLLCRFFVDQCNHQFLLVIVIVCQHHLLGNLTVALPE